MLVNYIPKQAQKETQWSGGSTIQLCIYPSDSSYELKDFLFRISSANVMVIRSSFTHLPGVSRSIMILDGEVKLQHKDQYSKVLRRFDTDQFEGEWNTTSQGLCKDFNLMTIGSCNGKLQNIILNSFETLKTQLFSKERFVGYYLNKGEVSLTMSTQKIMMFEDDFVLLESENKCEDLIINATKFSELVEVIIYL
jgi:environmental stress-induced protein Ves